MKSEGPVTRFKNCLLVKNGRIVEEDLLVQNGKIINPMDFFYCQKGLADCEVDCHGLLLAPGLIDLQLNGGWGIDFSRDIEDKESADKMIGTVAKQILSHGVTSFCPTLVTSPSKIYSQTIPYINRRPGSSEGAGILGLHMEGPFIAKEKKGCHNESYLQTLTNGFQDVLDVYGTLDNVAIITLAPELDPDGEVIKTLSNKGIIVSLGHTTASLIQCENAVNAGARMVTHLFNAMVMYQHRTNPGLPGLLTSRNLNRQAYYTLIADGIHVHPNNVRTAINSNRQGFCLISDTNAPLGLQDGTYQFFSGQTVDVKGDRVVVAGTDTLCGAKLSIYEGMRKLPKMAGISNVEAIEAATLKPAQILGIQGSKGTLDFGSDADFILLDPDNLDVYSTWIGGQCAWKK